EIITERLSYVEEIFEAVRKLDEKLDKEKSNNQEVTLTQSEKEKRLEQILSPEIIEAVDENTFLQLIDLTEEERKEGKDIFTAALKDTLDEGVRTQNIQTARNN